jgi:transcriptional regulator with XRE-family HTH domain
MNRLDIFSQNLRRECARFESIAEVCRLANVNRQQFSKYLAGQSLPSAAVLRKICSTLNVQEKILFVEPVSIGEQASIPVSILSLGQLVKDFGGESSSLTFTETGNYYCYFLLAHVPGMVVRAFIQVKKNTWCVNFTRITILPASRENFTHMSKGRHKGIILCNSSEYYFLGVNRYAPNQMSFMTAERKNSTQDRHFTGVAVTRIGNVATTAKFCMVPISAKVKMRDIIKTLGLVHQAELNTEAYVMVSLLQ